MAYGHIAYVGKGTTPFTMTNPTVIMTVDNVVMLCSDITGVSCGSGDTIFTLPDSSLFPASKIVRSVYTMNENTNSFETRRIDINPDGTVTVPLYATAPRTYYTNGLVFSVNDQYYSSTIGNNDMSLMTTPISAR